MVSYHRNREVINDSDNPTATNIIQTIHNTTYRHNTNSHSFNMKWVITGTSLVTVGEIEFLM